MTRHYSSREQFEAANNYVVLTEDPQQGWLVDGAGYSTRRVAASHAYPGQVVMTRKQAARFLSERAVSTSEPCRFY